jgi:hypothetical protein
MKRRFMYLAESNAQPVGVGEPGVPPFVPAMCNAVFAAAGQDLVAWTIHRGHGRAGMRRSGVSATNAESAESLPGRRLAFSGAALGSLREKHPQPHECNRIKLLNHIIILTFGLR